MREMLEAFNSQQDWPDRLRAVACEIVENLRHDPNRASFAVEVLSAGDAARARRDMTMRVIASLIDAGRNEMDDPEAVPHTTAEALAGSAYGQVYAKVVRGEADELPTLVPQLMSAAVMPYLGVEAGLAELARGFDPPARYRRDVAKKSSPGKSGGTNVPAEDYPPELARLPPGRHGLPREFVVHNQRERLIAGLAEAIAENGYSGTTIAHITRHAAVSRRTFYEHFSSKDECFVAAYDVAIERIRECVTAACEEASGEEWPRRVGAATAALLQLLSDDPALASITLVEGLRAGREVYDRYQGALDSFVGYLHEGAPSAPQGGEVPEATGEAVVGGIASLLGRRILAGEAERLSELFPEILEFILSAYLGAEQARRIISAG